VLPSNLVFRETPFSRPAISANGLNVDPAWADACVVLSYWSLDR